MNAPVTLPIDPAPPGADDPTAARLARAQGVGRRQLAVLERLAEVGMAVALAIEREAHASDRRENDAPPPLAGGGRALQGLATAYARTARAVRMTLALQARLLRELEGIERQGAFNLQMEAPRRLQARKARAERIVRRVAEGQDEDAEQVEALLAEAAERLGDEDVYGDVLTRPIGEIVARICADLGLAFDASAFAHEAWAEAEITDPRSPFAGLRRAGAQDSRGYSSCDSS